MRSAAFFNSSFYKCEEFLPLFKCEDSALFKKVVDHLCLQLPLQSLYFLFFCVNCLAVGVILGQKVNKFKSLVLNSMLLLAKKNMEPVTDRLESVELLLAQNPKLRILVLTMYANEEYAIRLIKSGAAGFIVKGASTDELLQAIRKVSRKGTYVTTSIMEKMVERVGQKPGDSPESALSNRELQVLVRLARGATSREVAQELTLSMSTVETHRSRVLEKLGLRNNSDITRFAIRRKLIDDLS